MDVSKEAGTVRPGAPSFGRAMGESNLQKNSIIRSAHQAIQKHNELWDKRTKDQDQVESIQKIADSFFKNKDQISKEKDLVNNIMFDQAQEVDIPPSVEIPEISLSEFKNASEKPRTEMTEQELELPDVGRYIDVMA